MIWLLTMETTGLPESSIGPDGKVHGANIGPMWAPWWPHKPCYQGNVYMNFEIEIQEQTESITPDIILSADGEMDWWTEYTNKLGESNKPPTTFIGWGHRYVISSL